MIQVLLAWLAALTASLTVDHFVQPRSSNRRNPEAFLIQAGIIGIAYSVLLTVTQRPWFSAMLVLALQLLIVFVNNAKYKALREPFVFTDFGLFSQAIRHPRLYLPFLGVIPALGGTAVIVIALYLGIAFEPSLLETNSLTTLALMVVSMFLLSLLAVFGGQRLASAPTLDPIVDLKRFGLLPSLWLYRLMESLQDPRDPRHPARGKGEIRIATTPSTTLPHIVTVQSESFFDARRLYPGVMPNLLKHFDAARQGAAAHGQLRVPAWGANTMRTEFAFLSGIAAKYLGVHRFNPYRRFARHPWPTIASELRAAGYRTICVHPHPASFFARDRVYPLLGFDEFVDIRAFNGGDKYGPYISDAAVTEKIRDILSNAKQPTFVFAITMENHGPLHLETVSPTDIEALYQVPPPADHDDLTVYLRHLKNADAMLGALVAHLRAIDDGGVLCWYGDHVPSMPRVYAANGFEDGHSDYLIWRNGADRGEPQTVAADELAQRLLEAAGLAARN